jgi:ribosomal protein L7Ae-like RNA K-turn-binding protein
MCDYYKIPLLIVESIGEAIGKPGRIVMAVTDDAFCKMIQECIPQDYNQGE